MTDQSRTIQELLRENASLKKKIQKMEQATSPHTNHLEILNENGEKHCRVEEASKEELLVDDKIKYQELAESISDVFFAMDKNLKYTYWNKASVELTGISADRALGKTLMDLFPDNKALQQVKDMYLRVMETKKPEHMTVNYPGDDHITHEISTYPSREGVSVFVKDITGSIQAELALRESEKKFRTIIDNNPTSMAIVNMAGTIEYINRKAIETFGYELIDIPDMDHWWRLAYPDETYRAETLTQWMGLVQNAMTQQSEIEKREYLITCKSGIVKTVLVYGTIITDKVFVMFEDVTERTQAVKVLQHAHHELEERVKERTTVLTQVNEALKESEKRYRHIVETSLDGIWVINADFQTTYLNQRMADMLGYNMEEILGKEVRSFIFEEDLEDYELRAAARRRNLSEVFERRFRRKDGTAVWNIISSTALCDNEGRFTGSYSMFTDITARKQAEEEVRHSREELKAIYDHVQVMICVVDENRHVLYANPALTKFTAVSEDELKGGTACGAFGCLNALDDPRGCGFGANCPNCALRLAMEDTIKTGMEHTNVEHHTIWMIKGCRRKVTLLLSTALMHKTDQNHLLLCLHDITDRKQAEELLRASEEVAKLLAKENELIAEIGQIIGSTLNIEEVYERFAEKVKEAIHFDSIAINTISNTKDTRTLRYYNGTISGNRQGETLLMAGTRTEHVVRNKSSLLIDSNNCSDREIAFPGMLSRANSQSTMIIPLFSRDEVFATMTIHSAQMHAYSEKDLSIAERVGSQIAGAIANAQLLHQCIQVEESLRESESKFRSLASTVDSLFLVDRECRHLFANESYLATFGPMRDLVIGKKYEELHEEEVSRTFAKSVNYVFDTGNPYHDEWLGIRSGKYLARTFGPVKNDEGIIVAVVIASKDITDRKQAEEALCESEKAAIQLAKESDLLAEIGRIISSTLNIEEVYERFAEKVGEVIQFDRIAVNSINMKDYTRTILYAKGDKFSGDRIGKVSPLAGTGAEQVTIAKQSILVSSKNKEDMIKNFPGIVALQFGAQSTMIIPLVLHDEVFGVLVLHSLLVDAYSENDLRIAEKVGSQIVGAIANAHLFIERRQAEEAKQSLADRLQRAEKMEALGQLAGFVAHDLNNVLGILTGYSELLLEEVPGDSNARCHAEKILQSTQKGAAIIQDLLTMARRGVTVSEVVHLNGLVSEFLESPAFFKIKEYHPRVKFRADYDMDILNIKGSPIHLEKTLMNLVSNAAEAISGDGEVIIRTESRYLDRPIHGYDEIEEGDYTVLIVSDTGTGVSAEDRDKIFEPFYTKKKMGRSGTGLGLAIVWGTVKDHKGYIDIKTSVGSGTTFMLYFPVTQDELIAQQEKIPLKQYMGNGESILVVDDIEEQREIASRLLTRLGYRVSSVTSGEDALEYLKSNKVDLLILDMIMEPGIDGLETFKRVRELNYCQKTIIVSGFSETDRIKEAEILGVGLFVKKPYVLEKIGVAIRDELAK